MTGFVITGHGAFAEGLASAIAMVAGDQPAFEALTFTDDRAASYGDDLARAVTRMRTACDGVVVLCDLVGGTPFNQAMLVSAADPAVRVVAGANLPMLIETLFARNANPGLGATELAQMAVAAGGAGVALGELPAAPADACADDDGEGI